MKNSSHQNGSEEGPHLKNCGERPGAGGKDVGETPFSEQAATARISGTYRNTIWLQFVIRFSGTTARGA